MADKQLDGLSLAMRPPMLKVDPSSGRSGDEIDHLIRVNQEIDRKWEVFNVIIANRRRILSNGE